MESVRKPFQGVWNIMRFNWHFYLIAALVTTMLFILCAYLAAPIRSFALLSCYGLLVTMFISLATSYYIYDFSGLYKLDWVNRTNDELQIMNINAGFDETSVLLSQQFSNIPLKVYDFYDATRHTEVSIKRARKAYPPYPGTQCIETHKIPDFDDSTDKVFNLFSAHEIRDQHERICFFKELKRILKADGEIIVTEHLRDTANFLAYNIGFFHFHSRATWLDTFASAGLNVKSEEKINPFITVFKLSKNGNPS